MPYDPVTLDELMAALPDVLAAPKTDAPIHSLCFRPGFNQRSFPDSLTLTRDQGVPGERWLTTPWLRLPDGAPDPGIQVSILPTRVMDLVWRDRDGTPHPGDTIVADLNTSLDNLPEGTLLQAGTAVLRVTSIFNDGCVKWRHRYGDAAKAWITMADHPRLRLRGILCAVETDGVVTLSDTIRVIQRG